MKNVVIYRRLLLSFAQIQLWGGGGDGRLFAAAGVCEPSQNIVLLSSSTHCGLPAAAVIHTHETPHSSLSCVQKVCPIWPFLHLQDQILLTTSKCLISVQLDQFCSKLLVSL